jgi:hypothetical protein
MLTFIKSKIIENEFILKKINIFFSSVFIVRYCLLNSIKKYSREIKGRTLDFGCGSKPYQDIFVNSTEYIGVDIKSSGHNHINSKGSQFIVDIGDELFNVKRMSIK